MQTLQKAIERAEKAQLTVWQAKGIIRVWCVLAQEETRQRGFPCFHLVKYDWQEDRWLCECKATTENCIHVASVILFCRKRRAELDAKQATRHVQAKHLYMGQEMPSRPPVVLQERVTEEW